MTKSCIYLLVCFCFCFFFLFLLRFIVRSLSGHRIAGCEDGLVLLVGSGRVFLILVYRVVHSHILITSLFNPFLSVDSLLTCGLLHNIDLNMDMVSI